MPDGPLSLDALRAEVASGAIDTVVLAIVDVQGRLQGKRFDAEYFLDEVVAHGTEGCNYLLAVDVEMNTVDGYAHVVVGARLRRPRDGAGPRRRCAASRGSRAPRCCWPTRSGSTALRWSSHRGRSCRRQLDRLAERGWVAMVGTELEFILFDDTYEAAWSKRYVDLTPSNQYNVDYSILGTSRVEPLLREIRLGMRDAGLQVESAKGECNPGQHEIAFKYADALTTCDNHVDLQERAPRRSRRSTARR